MSSTLVSRGAFEAFAKLGRAGGAGAGAAVIIQSRDDLGLATLTARKDQEEALRGALKETYGLDLLDAPKVAEGERMSLVGSGPGQWLAVSEVLQNEQLAQELEQRLEGLVSIADQSSGRAVLRLTGPGVREVLAKGLPIDLHPSVFCPGSAATTSISHIGVHLWQVDDAPTYDIALFRSFAGSFWRWLTESAAASGYEVRAQ